MSFRSGLVIDIDHGKTLIGPFENAALQVDHFEVFSVCLTFADFFDEFVDDDSGTVAHRTIANDQCLLQLK